MGRARGFLLIEVVVGVGILIIVLGIVFQLLRPVAKLQELGVSRTHLLQNQTLVMQRISQQVAVYTRAASIQTGSSDRLMLTDVAGNRLVSFYQANETESGTAVLYMSTQVPPAAAGSNQLTDPYNVTVVKFKVYKLNNKKIRVELELREKSTGKTAVFSEVIELLNGEVL